MTGFGQAGRPARAALLAVLIAGGATAQDVEMGRDIAYEYCVACHDVGPNGAFKQDPPSFTAIAIYRTEEQIRVHILRPFHDDMPKYKDYMIGENIDDMVAYIASLEN